ncbi:MAG: hypothetical protein IKH95_05940 [Bacteroidaceae bacterium]|jgi:hypothetical protein|nr:hypothetical protein [Bacteroidaceae bacterium]
MKRNILFLLVAVVLTSCSSITLGIKEIDQVFPATVSFPEQIQKVGVIDRVNLTTQDHSINPFYLNSVELSRNFAVKLAEADYFEDVILCDSDISTWDKEEDKVYPLSSVHIQELCEDLDVDMIISLERVHSSLVESDYAPVVAMEAIMRLYLPYRDRPFRMEVLKDTIMWDTEGLLTYTNARQDMVDYMAEKAAHEFAPHWRTIERTFFEGGNVDMRDAAMFVQENDWEKAKEIWTNASKKSKGKIKEEYEFNIIVAEEMLGNVETAYKKCQELESRTIQYSDLYLLANTYSQVLRKRLSDIQTLNLQMHRFE